MVLGHYLKREFETIFIHRFSNDTMPFFNVFKNSFHYWLLMGVGSMYFFLHPLYTEPSYGSDQIYYALFAGFVFFEFMNFMCHVVLRDLRKPGSSERGIPNGWGFGYISCANYFWECLIWTSFSVLSGCAGAWFFAICSSL